VNEKRIYEHTDWREALDALLEAREESK